MRLRRIIRGDLSRNGRLSRRQRWLLGGVAALLFALAHTPFIAPPVRPTVPASADAGDLSQFWRPVDIEAADLFYGPWGAAFAPDPDATYTFLEPKRSGNSPGMTVREAPVYHLPSFLVLRDGRVDRVEGGRFRPKLDGVEESGSWSWQQNPFVGTPPYQGLLVLLMILNSSDIKNANNSIYELSEPREGATRWFVVRDLGASLGETARLDPPRGDPDRFERVPFITSITDGFVRFNYRGWHQELV
jgi:hypothetical protein